MKKIFALLLAAVLCVSAFSIVAAAEGEDFGFKAVAVESAFASAVTVTPLDASGAAVTAVDGVYSQAAKLKVTYTDAAANSFYLVVAMSGTGVPTKDNLVYINQVTASGSSVTFTVYPGGMKDGETYSIYLSSSGSDLSGLTKVASYQYFGEDTDCLIGDVNNDGKINAKDNILMARFIARWTGYEEQVNMDAADVSGDGNVNAKDNIILARYIAGWTGYETLPLA